MQSKNDLTGAVFIRSVLAALALGFAPLLGCSEAPAPAPEKSQANSQVAPAPAPVTQQPIDACGLVTSEEIEAIQGEPVQEQTPSAKPDLGVANGQCFFKLPTFTKSISLSVTTSSEPGPHSPREFWKTAFAEKRVNPPERADGRIKLAPERVAGLGDEAFWTGGPAGGLYILKADSVVFIGIGSAGDEAGRRENARRIGEIVIQRL